MSDDRLPPAVNFEVEQALLGAILVNNDAYYAVSAFLLPKHFSEPLHQSAFRSISTMLGMGKKVTPATLKANLRDVKLVGPNVDSFDLGGYIARLAAEAVTIVNAPHYGRVVLELWTERQVRELGARMANDEPRVDVAASIEEAEATLSELRRALGGKGKGAGMVTAAQGGDMLRQRADEIAAGKYKIPSSGLADVDERLGGGCWPGRLMVVAGRPGMGKAQPLDAKVLTVAGWRPMGDIRPRDAIVRPGGGVSFVSGVFPQGKKPVYKITFHDGRTTRSCGEHLWRVWHRRWGAWRDVELRSLLRYADVTRFSVPLRLAEGGSLSLPIDPYLLGILLGDGSIKRTVMFSTADEEIVESVKAVLPAGLSVRHRGGVDYAITSGKRRGSNPILKALRELDAFGKGAHQKRVPFIYLDGSSACREAILQGLLDTDGTVERDKTIRFSSTSEGLADDVVYLARSLGGWAKKRERALPRHQGGDGRRCWVVTIRHCRPHSLFRISRKRRRLGDGGQYAENLRLSIASIEPDGEVECQCIMLGDPDGLYFTDDFTVTHNTVLMTEISRRVAYRGRRAEHADERFAAGFVTLEVDATEVTARTLAGMMASSDWPLPYRDIMTGKFNSEGDRARFNHALTRLEGLPLYIEHAPGATMPDIVGRVRLMKEKARRDGYILGTVAIDYLQLVRATERYRGNQTQEIGEAAWEAKTLAQEENVFVILGSQLNRSVEDRDDKRPDVADLRGSGNIEEHADVVAMLYRQHYYLERSKPKNMTDEERIAKLVDVKNDIEIIFGKNRIGPAGTTHAYIDVALSRVDDKSRRGG